MAIGVTISGLLKKKDLITSYEPAILPSQMFKPWLNRFKNKRLPIAGSRSATVSAEVDKFRTIISRASLFLRLQTLKGQVHMISPQKQIVADLTLDKQMLQDVLKKRAEASPEEGAGVRN